MAWDRRMNKGHFRTRRGIVSLVPPFGMKQMLTAGKGGSVRMIWPAITTATAATAVDGVVCNHDGGCERRPVPSSSSIWKECFYPFRNERIQRKMIPMQLQLANLRGSYYLPASCLHSMIFALVPDPRYSLHIFSHAHKKKILLCVRTTARMCAQTVCAI